MYLRIELSCTLLNFLMPVVVDRLISWKGGIILEASIFKLLLNINVSFQLLHFSLALPIISSRFSLRSWMLVLLLICASFDNVMLFSLRRTGTLRAHSCCFLFLMIFYEHYKAESAISLFQTNKLFSHHFRGFKLEISDPQNSRNPIRFPALSNTYSSECRYDPFLCQNKLIYRQRINGLTNRLILTAPFRPPGDTWWTRPLYVRRPYIAWVPLWHMVLPI